MILSFVWASLYMSAGVPPQLSKPVWRAAPSHRARPSGADVRVMLLFSVAEEILQVCVCEVDQFMRCHRPLITPPALALLTPGSLTSRVGSGGNGPAPLPAPGWERGMCKQPLITLQMLIWCYGAQIFLSSSFKCEVRTCSKGKSETIFFFCMFLPFSGKNK